MKSSLVSELILRVKLISQIRYMTGSRYNIFSRLLAAVAAGGGVRLDGLIVVANVSTLIVG
jgi:hypothetical protein